MPERNCDAIDSLTGRHTPRRPGRHTLDTRRADRPGPRLADTCRPPRASGPAAPARPPAGVRSAVSLSLSDLGARGVAGPDPLAP